METFDWVIHYDRVYKNSKIVRTHGQTLAETPPMQLQSALEILEEILGRPEIMNAYKRSNDEEQINKSGHYTLWHGSYITNKYGNQPDPMLFLSGILIDLANGEYNGPDDPKLLNALKHSRWVEG